MVRSSKRQPASLADRLLAQGRAGAATNDDLARAAERSFRSVDRALLIPLERVEPWSDNPRLTLRNEVRGKDPDGIDDLAASIAERGILQTLVVRRHPDKPGYYITIAGARRLLAARKVSGSSNPEERERVAEIPCIVKEETDEDAFADALAENLARHDLTREEKMAALERLHKQYGWGVREIHRRTGMSIGNISELIKLAETDEVRDLIAAKVINPTVGVALRHLPEALRPAALQQVREGNITRVRDVEAFRARHQGTDAAGARHGVFTNEQAVEDGTPPVEVFTNEHLERQASTTLETPAAPDDQPIASHLLRGSLTPPHEVQVRAHTRSSRARPAVSDDAVDRLARDMITFAELDGRLTLGQRTRLAEAHARLGAYLTGQSRS